MILRFVADVAAVGVRDLGFVGANTVDSLCGYVYVVGMRWGWLLVRASERHGVDGFD